MTLNDEGDDLEEDEASTNNLTMKKRQDQAKKQSVMTNDKKKKKKGKVGKTYPSRYMLIGEIHCIFLSCYYKGKSPLLTLGPSWPFTSVLIVLGLLMLFYFYIMMQMASKAPPMHKLWCQLCILLNVMALFGGILKNPGIP